MDPLHISRVWPPVLRDFFAAEQAYRAARQALASTYGNEVRLWLAEEDLTEAQIIAQLRLYQVPEDMLQAILDTAKDPEAAKRA